MKLSVAERLRVAAAFHFAESPGVPLSIAKLCAAASVNRANAYQRHEELLRELTRTSKHNRGDRARQTSRNAAEQIKTLNEAYRKQTLEYKALLNLCIEQMAEIRSLRLKALTSVVGRQKKGASDSRS